MPSAISGGPSSHANIPSNEECGIRDVWKHNLEEEFRTIRQIVHKYHYVAMDTEFPGVVARPIGEFRSTADYQYQLLRCNVDLLRIIQLGLTSMDEEGKTPPGYSTWKLISNSIYRKTCMRKIRLICCKILEYSLKNMKKMELIPSTLRNC